VYKELLSVPSFPGTIADSRNLLEPYLFRSSGLIRGRAGFGLADSTPSTKASLIALVFRTAGELASGLGHLFSDTHDDVSPWCVFDDCCVCLLEVSFHCLLCARVTGKDVEDLFKEIYDPMKHVFSFPFFLSNHGVLGYGSIFINV
jgi:hypothetical protein